MEWLQDETATVVITLHSPQAAATLKGSLLWVPKRLESITKARCTKSATYTKKILLSKRTDELRKAKNKVAVRDRGKVVVSKNLYKNFRLYVYSIF